MKIAVFYENIMEGVTKEGLEEEKVLEELAGLGMELVYISYEALKERKDFLLPLFSKLGLKVEGLHWAFDFGQSPEAESYRKAVDLAKEAGAGSLLIVPGMISEEKKGDRERIRNNMKTALSKAVRYGEERGIAVCMEDYDSMEAPYHCVEELEWFLEQVSGLRCCFDAGNFVVCHEDELEAFHRLRSRICTLHLKDRAMTKGNPGDGQVVCADGAVMYPAPVGGGCMKIAEILQELKKDGYAGNVVVELFDYAQTLAGLKQSVAWVKELL